MPRSARATPGGVIYHILNRAVARMRMLRRDEDFHALQRIMLDAHARFDLPILSYCLLSNHWHFVVAPETDKQVTEFFRWFTLTHAMRWRVSHRTVGYGPLYQGRFKSFPVEEDNHLLSLLRYVERNALSAGLVKRAEAWRWCSLWARLHPADEMNAILSSWPIDRPRNWLAQVNQAMSSKEIEPIQASIVRNRPLGSDQWITRVVKRLHLEHTMRNRGRPKAQASKKLPESK